MRPVDSPSASTYWVLSHAQCLHFYCFKLLSSGNLEANFIIWKRLAWKTELQRFCLQFSCDSVLTPSFAWIGLGLGLWATLCSSLMLLSYLALNVLVKQSNSHFSNFFSFYPIQALIVQTELNFDSHELEYGHEYDLQSILAHAY